MTDLLLKIFTKKSKTDDIKRRAAVGKLSGTVGIVCNILLCVAKLVIGIISGSVSITADAMNNLSDASGSVITLLGFKLAEKPADADHPYGHARFEYLSGLAVAALIVIIGFELAKSSVEKIINPTDVEFNFVTELVIIFSVLVKLWLYFFNKRLAKMINSSALEATALDSRNDVISTLAVLSAIYIDGITDFNADGFIGFAVALFVLYNGVCLAKETISPLLGENADPEQRRLIANMIKSHPKVLGFHDLMVHDYGPGQRFASLHVEMDASEDPLVCHDIIDDLERECFEKYNIHLVIHYDPVTVGDPELEKMKAEITEILHSFNSSLSMHDFRMVKGIGHTNLIFDIALPSGVNEKEVKRFVVDALEKNNGEKYYTVITFDCEAFNLE